MLRLLAVEYKESRHHLMQYFDIGSVHLDACECHDDRDLMEAVEWYRSGGSSVQQSRPSARTFQSLSRSVAAPGKRQAMLMVARGIGVCKVIASRL